MDSSNRLFLSREKSSGKLVVVDAAGMKGVSEVEPSVEPPLRVADTVPSAGTSEVTLLCRCS